MYIYKTTNTLNGKIYIGLSTRKVEDSTDYYGSGTLFYRSLKKYGKENFTKEILVRDIEDKKQLAQLEIDHIKEYNSTDKNIGYNLTLGGEGTLGIKHTPETIEKIRSYSLNQPDEVIKKRALANTGKIRSEETKAQTSETMKGRVYDEERCAAMRGPRGKIKLKSSTCPHCNLTGRSGNMTRYHFDNCKSIK